MTLPLLILAISALALLSNAQWESTVTYNNGQWQTTTTPEVWTPTTTSYYAPWTPSTTPSSYWYGYTSYTYSTYTSCYTEGTVIITITSLIPCPVTETSVVYECDTCTTTVPPPVCEGCQDTSTESILTGVEYSTQSILTGVEYTTPISTYTSNGYVVVVVGTETPTQQAQTQVQVIYANSADRSMRSSGNELVGSAVLAASLLMGILAL